MDAQESLAGLSKALGCVDAAPEERGIYRFRQEAVKMEKNKRCLGRGSTGLPGPFAIQAPAQQSALQMIFPGAAAISNR